MNEELACNQCLTVIIRKQCKDNSFYHDMWYIQMSCVCVCIIRALFSKALNVEQDFYNHNLTTY